MAKFIGNHKKYISDLNPDPVQNINSHYDGEINNQKYFGILCRNDAARSWKNGHTQLVRMTANYTFEVVHNQLKNRLLDLRTNWYDINVAHNIAFSENMEYGVIQTSGVTGTLGDGVLFIKRQSNGQYTELASPTGTLSTSYWCDISPDGTFAVTISASTPYYEFYKRTGDTWAVLAAPPTEADPVSTIGKFKNFTSDNTAYFGNDGSNTWDTFQAMRYDSGTNKFVRQTTTGLPGIHMQSLTFSKRDNTFFVSMDLTAPYVRCFTSSNGLDFTEGTVNNVPSAQHYNPVMDPSGTYVFCQINNSSYTFGVYKRNGNDLDYLGQSAFDTVPASASVTTREGISWSPDSRFVFIGDTGGIDDWDGCMLYERIGDNFYLRNGPEHIDVDLNFNFDNDWLVGQGSGAINSLYWLPENFRLNITS